MLRLLLVFGTRPEAIKFAPLILLLKEQSWVHLITCVTAQHRQMLDQVLAWFGIVPDYDLNLMQPEQSLPQFSSRVLQEVDRVISLEKPDFVLVQGDTTSALAAAWAAFYRRIPVGHLEAGLRTDDLQSPFPEEANRRVITVLSTLHFAPTAAACDRLLREGIPAENVHMTGNTVIDALQWTIKRAPKLSLDIPLDRPGERLILVTAHRRESFGKEFENICHALLEITRRNPDVRLIYPVHLNPNVREPVFRLLANHARIHLIEPLPYPDLIALLDRVYFVLTDSGGMQEEAPALGKPVLVMRQKTERPEAIEAGTARLVGTSIEAITAGAQTLLDHPDQYQAMARVKNPFGDGTASEQIAAILRKYDKQP